METKITENLMGSKAVADCLQPTAKHTPGPLTVRHSEVMRGVVQVFDSEGMPIANFARAETSGANLANAILFVGAPDLLEAAKAALDRLEAWGERHEFLARTLAEGPACDQHRNQAANYGALAADLQAAIAKAEGEATATDGSTAVEGGVE